MHPTLLPEDLLLAKVDGVFNAIQIDTDVAGRILLYGRGAGPDPTASAVISDVLRIAKAMSMGQANGWPVSSAVPKAIRPMEESESQFYVRMTVEDTYGVLAQITQIFNEMKISLASVIQKRFGPREQYCRDCIDDTPRIGEVDAVFGWEDGGARGVREIGNVIRVEG